MNADISLLRDFIQTYGLYLQVVAFVAYVIYAKQRSAFFYCLLLVIIIAPIHLLLENQLLHLAENPDNNRLVYNGWYLGYAYTDALLVILAIYLCKTRALIIDSVSRMIMISYFCLGMVQLIRYFDRVILESDKLGDVYSIIVPTINVSVTVLVCVYVVYFISNGMYQNKKRAKH